VAASPAPAATVTQIASGLDNPRALAIGPHNRLYVAEAGHGGQECIPEANPAGGPLCVGFTSGISTIDRSGVHRVVSGLASEASPEGFGATGNDGVSLNGNGDLFGVEALSSDVFSSPLPLSEETITKGRQQLGRLIQANPSGHFKVVADVGHFDFQWSAEHKELNEQFPDANPYAVLAEPGTRWVVDAASNTLDQVRANGSISVIAYIPNPPVSDAVPTCVARGSDGAFYVGQLTGGGNGPGKASIWRVVPGSAPTQWANGLTAVTGCGFGSDGKFYASEFSTLGFEHAAPGTGAFVLVPPQSTSPTVIASGLSFPNGFAPGPHSSSFVSNWSIAPANSGGGPTGEVVQITP
jgi:hypothetical protein